LKAAPGLSGHQLNLLDNRFGYFVGTIASTFCQRHKIKPELVGWHGHTVFHDPEQQSTCQIGHGGALAAAARLPVITQFRQIDLSLGGQGAPLAPLADKMLLEQADFYLNLGGISNIAFIDRDGHLRSFDVCPCNQILNRLANQIDMEYDSEGRVAAGGSLLPSLLKELNDFEFYKQSPPKSIDNNWVMGKVWPVIEKADGSIGDKLATVSHHIAWQISQVILLHNKLHQQPTTVVITGGGAYNAFIVQLIDQYLERINHQIELPSKDLIEFKEAALMGLMAYLFVKGLENVFSDVTGSSEDHIGGCLFQAPGSPKIIYG
jgi:anhydro-N-acetylmuramic acid kinase